MNIFLSISDDKYIYGSDPRGIAYTGKYGRFKDNISCLEWDDPIIKIPFDKWKFTDKGKPGPYCRNPKDDNGAYAGEPYCFIPDRLFATFQMCDVLKSVGKCVSGLTDLLLFFTFT